VWFCVDATPGAAIWKDVSTPGAGTHPVVTVASDPTVNDDSGDGYAVGDHWINTATGGTFQLTDATVGAAVWKRHINNADPAGGDLKGTFTDPLVRRASEEFALSGQLTPAQITANQNNYNPTSLASASTLRLSSDASRTITGLAGGVAGRLIVLMNVGSFPILLSNEDALSTAGNRFTLGSTTTLVSGAVLTLLYDGTTLRWRSQAGTGGAGGGAGGTIQSQWVEVADNKTTTATTWPAANTTVAALSNGAVLPQATINVASTTGFPAAGRLVVITAAGSQEIAYTGTTATTFTGCTGGVGTLITGALLFVHVETTIAAGSNGVALPTGTINVVSTTGFPASGTLLVTTSLNTRLVAYSGLTGTSFTGCLGGSGVMSTGGFVTNVTATPQDLLRIDILTNGGAIVVQAMGCASNATNNAVVFFRVVLDGVVHRGGSTKSNGGSGVTAFALSLKDYDLLAGDHVIQIQWRVNSGTGQVRPITAQDENASLLVQEVAS
jgi:hypothetical protein